MRILAVDDDPVFRDLLLAMLRSHGYTDVTMAASPQIALRELDDPTQSFDCLLFDIQMPGMSGIELVEVVRRKKAYRRTPIMMITSMSDKGSIDSAFAAGATDYVTKPLDRLEIKARMGMVARLHEERQRMAALELHGGLSSYSADLHLDFSAPLFLPGVDRGFEYRALENYLLTLRFRQPFTIAAIGFHIENAQALFNKTRTANFVNMLGDVQTAILDAVKTEQMMLAYAGSGNFVGLVSRNFSLDPEDVNLAIGIGLQEFEGVYAADGMQMPRVNVGKLARRSVLAPFRPTRILKQAIEKAQLQPAKDHRKKAMAL